MLAVSEKARESTILDTATAPAPLPDGALDPGIDAAIHVEDKFMIWLLLAFFVLLGGTVLSEFVLRVFLGLQI